jgi:hypothetical protein
MTDPVCRIAVLSILAAGQAITLTAASTVVFAELHWTPGLLLQAEDRAHRIGQTAAVVRVEYVLGSGTVDELLVPLLRKKLGVLGELGIIGAAKHASEHEAAHGDGQSGKPGFASCIDIEIEEGGSAAAAAVAAAIADSAAVVDAGVVDAGVVDGGEEGADPGSADEWTWVAKEAKKEDAQQQGYAAARADAERGGSSGGSSKSLSRRRGIEARRKRKRSCLKLEALPLYPPAGPVCSTAAPVCSTAAPVCSTAATTARHKAEEMSRPIKAAAAAPPSSSVHHSPTRDDDDWLLSILHDLSATSAKEGAKGAPHCGQRAAEEAENDKEGGEESEGGKGGSESEEGVPLEGSKRPDAAEDAAELTTTANQQPLCPVHPRTPAPIEAVHTLDNASAVVEEGARPIRQTPIHQTLSGPLVERLVRMGLGDHQRCALALDTCGGNGSQGAELMNEAVDRLLGGWF